VEFLLAACILGVGLLGLGALQVAAARGLACTWNRLIAATLAGNAVETALAGAEPGGLAGVLANRKFKAADVNAALADLARIAARSGQEAEASKALAVLADRGAPNLQALQAELAPAAGKAAAFRLDNGRPAPIRPRDLTWAMLTNVLNKEGAK